MSNLRDEFRRIANAVNKFASEMRIYLYTKARIGYSGWDNPNEIPSSDLIKHMQLDLQVVKEAFEAGKVDNNTLKLTIDIANRSMMLWYRILH